MKNSYVWSYFAAVLRLSVPLTFAALGGYFSERAGIVNIGLEGLMLISAFSSAACAIACHSQWIGLAAGIGSAVLLVSLHAFLCIKCRSDHIISGLAINLLAAGIPPVLCKVLYDASGGTPMLENADRMTSIFGLSPLLLLSFVVLLWCEIVHRFTRLGQYLRFAGEHPKALESQGVSVAYIQWIGVLMSGVLCGLAGAYLAIDHGGGFSRNMTSGRGFIAIAALVLGRWTPLGAFVAAFLFAGIEALQIFLQGVVLPNSTTMPVQWIQMIPYIATLTILAFKLPLKRKNAMKSLATGFAIVLLLTTSGCKMPDGLVSWFNENMAQNLEVKLVPFAAKIQTEKKEDAIPDRSRVNGEFIKELFKVVLERDVRSEEEFNSYLNVLDQGGSYEGTYNRIVYGSEYRDREKGTAPVAALKAYARIMAQFILDAKYDPQKIIEATADKPSDALAGTPEAAKAGPNAAERDALIGQYEKDAITTPAYTLKRKLGEEAIKVIDIKKEYKEKLATWYGRFVVFLNNQGVDFGLQKRNVKDEYFHYKWALDAEEDRLKWEVLNRLHKIVDTKIK